MPWRRRTSGTPVGVPAMAGINNALNGAPFGILLLGTYALGVSSLFVRYRRGGEQERQQIKWLLVGVVLLLSVIVIQLVIPALQKSPLIPFAAACLPIAIAIGILRY